MVEGAGKYAFEYMTGGVGVVLGPIGFVAASGMTGGVIYLLQQPDLEAKIHADARLAPLDAADATALRALLERHARETASARAAALLASRTDTTLPFAKVIPRAG